MARHLLAEMIVPDDLTLDDIASIIIKGNGNPDGPDIGDGIEFDVCNSDLALMKVLDDTDTEGEDQPRLHALHNYIY